MTKDKFFLSVFLFSMLYLLGCNQSVSQWRENISPTNFQGNVRSFSVDELGYIYVVTDDNNLLRCDEEFNTLFQYSNKRLGRIHSIDVSNPLKLMVFFKDYGVVVSLDNTLSESNMIDLNDLELYDIHAIAMANDNNLWIYDPIQLKVKKIDNAGNTILESDPLFTQDDQQKSGSSIYQVNDRVYLMADEDIYIYNDYGKLLDQRRDVNAEAYQFLPTYEIVTYGDNTFSKLSLKDIFIDPQMIDITLDMAITDFHIQDNHIIMLTEAKELERLKL